MDSVRVLNEAGLSGFEQYLATARNGDMADAPLQLLTDGATSEPFYPEVQVEPREFDNAYEFGVYLNGVFAACDTRDLSRNHGLWSWLALYFFDALVPPSSARKRKVLENAAYALGPTFVFRRYYRHLVRTPWEAVRIHGELAKVLLITSGRGSRSEISEQIGAYQDLFGSRQVIAIAHRLYFDSAEQRPLRGAGGKGPGSPRRLAAVINQLGLTYDLDACPVEDFLALLPDEFARWVS